jgi:hypothetical protein
MAGSRVVTTTVRAVPVDAASIPTVARFLHENLNRRLSADAWAAAIVPPWADGPTYGFRLLDGEQLVGVYVAFFSRRVLAGRERRVCNLAAWCVLDGYGAHGLRLLRALLGSGADVFTDLSPSGAVVPIDRRLGFRDLDTTTSLRVNLPTLPVGSVALVTDPRRVAELLVGDDLAIYRDHRDAAAVRHLVLVVDGAPCYVMYRRVRRKRLPVFAAIVHVSDPAAFRRGLRRLGGHLALRGMPVLLAEHRIVGGSLRRAVTVGGRPKLFRAPELEPDDVDDLYSEITCVPW